MSELTPEQIEAVFSALPGIYVTEQSENVYLARAILAADRAQRQAGQEAVAFSQFLSDVMTAAGLVEHGKQCKALGQRLADGCATFRTMLYTTPPAAPVPEGYKLVPLEPTQEMIQAAFAGKVETQDCMGQMRRRKAMADDYSAMLAAAPDHSA